MTAMLVADTPSPATDQHGSLVLVVAADSSLAQLLERVLSVAGFRTERSTQGALAHAAVSALLPDAVLLDLASSGAVGLEVVRRVRAGSGVPILLLAAGDSIEERVASLDAGADDILPRPFATQEVLARLRAVLRGRAMAAAAAMTGARLGTLAYADVRIDQGTREAWRGDRRLELRNKALELLACFLRHPERVLSRHELLEEAWGFDFLGDSNVIEVTVSHVRQALEADGEPRLIHTVRPVGYILRASREPPSCPPPVDEV